MKLTGRKVAIAGLLFLCALSLLPWIGGQRASIAREWRQLERGRPRAEVHAVFGKPISDPSSFSNSRLEYFDASDGVILVGYDADLKVSVTDAFPMDWVRKLKWRYID